MPLEMTVDDLGRLLALYPRTIRGKAVGSDAMIADAVGFGVLVPVGTVERVVCDRCDEQHFAEIESVAGSQGWYCPADSFVRASPAEIAAYSVSVDAFVGHLAGAMDRPRRWARPQGAPILWSIGSMSISGLRVGTYYASNAGNPHVLTQVMRMLESEPRVDIIAVLTNDTRDLGGLILPRGGRLVSIVDVMKIGGHGIELQPEELGRHVIPDTLLRPRKAGRPNDAEKLAAEPILELGGADELGGLSQNERHHVLKAAAQRRLGPKTTLGKEACNKAWEAHLASHGRFRHGL